MGASFRGCHLTGPGRRIHKDRRNCEGCPCHLRNHHFNVKQVAAIRHYSALHTNHEVLQFNKVSAQCASGTLTPEIKEGWTRVSNF